MKFRMIAALCALAAGWALGEGRASAQSWQLGTNNPPQVRTRGPFSPYLNLGQGANAYEYYGIVKPQLDAARNFGQLQSGLANVQAGMANVPVVNQGGFNAAGFMMTGHPAGYMNYNRFFPLGFGTATGMMGMPGMMMGGPGMMGGGGLMTGSPLVGMSPGGGMGMPMAAPFFSNSLNRPTR